MRFGVVFGQAGARTSHTAPFLCLAMNSLKPGAAEALFYRRAKTLMVIFKPNLLFSGETGSPACVQTCVILQTRKGIDPSGRAIGSV